MIPACFFLCRYTRVTRDGRASDEGHQPSRAPGFMRIRHLQGREEPVHAARLSGVLGSLSSSRSGNIAAEVSHNSPRISKPNTLAGLVRLPTPRNSSNMRPRSCGAMPRPLSATDHSANPSPRQRHAAHLVAGAGCSFARYLTALSNRLPITCSSDSRSVTIDRTSNFVSILPSASESDAGSRMRLRYRCAQGRRISGLGSRRPSRDSRSTAFRSVSILDADLRI